MALGIPRLNWKCQALVVEVSRAIVSGWSAIRKLAGNGVVGNVVHAAGRIVGHSYKGGSIRD